MPERNENRAQHSNNCKHSWDKNENRQIYIYITEHNTQTTASKLLIHQQISNSKLAIKAEHNTPTTASTAGAKTKTDVYIYIYIYIYIQDIYTRAEHSNNNKHGWGKNEIVYVNIHNFIYAPTN